MVTVKAVFDNDTATNLIVNADADAQDLSGFANGAKLDLLRAWWALTQGTAAGNTGDCIIEFKGHHLMWLHYILLELDTMMVLLVQSKLLQQTAVTSSDITAQTRGTSGFVILEFRKDEAYTA